MSVSDTVARGFRGGAAAWLGAEEPMPRCSPLHDKCIIFLRPSDQEQSNVGVGAVSGGLYLLPADLEFEATAWLGS